MQADPVIPDDGKNAVTNRTRRDLTGSAKENRQKVKRCKGDHRDTGNAGGRKNPCGYIGLVADGVGTIDIREVADTLWRIFIDNVTALSRSFDTKTGGNPCEYIDEAQWSFAGSGCFVSGRRGYEAEAEEGGLHSHYTINFCEP